LFALNEEDMSTYHLAFLKIHYKLTALKYDLNQKPNLTLNNKNIKNREW